MQVVRQASHRGFLRLRLRASGGNICGAADASALSPRSRTGSRELRCARKRAAAVKWFGRHGHRVGIRRARARGRADPALFTLEVAGAPGRNGAHQPPQLRKGAPAVEGQGSLVNRSILAGRQCLGVQSQPNLLRDTKVPSRPYLRGGVRLEPPRQTAAATVELGRIPVPSDSGSEQPVVVLTYATPAETTTCDKDQD